MIESKIEVGLTLAEFYAQVGKLHQVAQIAAHGLLILFKQVVHLHLINAFEEPYNVGVDLVDVFNQEGLLGAFEVVDDDLAHISNDTVLPTVDCHCVELLGQLLLQLGEIK